MRRKWLWLSVAFLAVVIDLVALGSFSNEPLRNLLEQKMNHRLRGYTVQLGAAHFHPLGFSLELNDLIIKQNAHPDPPVAAIPTLTASVQWRALLFGRAVADFVFAHPSITINRTQTQKEEKDEVPVQERGWQEALESIYPFKINEFRIIAGDFTYVDEGPSRPLHLSQLNFRAGNIRNIRYPDRVYPSDVFFEGTVFESGRVRLDGHANFPAEPHVGVNAQITLEQVQLDYFTPLLQRHNFTIRNGLFSGAGQVEYAPWIKVYHLQNATIAGVQVAYTHTASSTPAEKKAARKTVQKTQELNNNPETIVRADRIDIVNSQFSFVNKEASPEYRLFLANAEFHLTNFTNHLTEGTSVGKLSGKFMDSGVTEVGATFRPETSGPDFDLAVRIEPLPMRLMNNLWRAYGNFDVVGGLFSFYSELTVKNGEISGYVKPLFQDLDVYDVRQDKDKNIFQQIYEGLIGGISWLLENPPRDEVATVTTVSGKLQNPHLGSWKAILGLIQNAFFKAILPGFEKAAGRPLKEPPRQTAKTMTFTPQER
jgi:hypothetical protein